MSDRARLGVRRIDQQPYGRAVRAGCQTCTSGSSALLPRTEVGLANLRQSRGIAADFVLCAEAE
jgi:hypothetical protein